MRISTGRLVLTGGAVVVLAAAGIGLVTAAGTPGPAAQSSVTAAATAGPSATRDPNRASQRDRLERRGAWGPRLLRLSRHLVHVEATVTDRDGQLIVLWFDHGTVQAAANGSVTISETGGGSKTVKTDDATIVRVGREDGTLADVTSGDEVFIHSRVVDGSAVAKRILIVPGAIRN